jgi:hypothetical protein
MSSQHHCYIMQPSHFSSWAIIAMVTKFMQYSWEQAMTNVRASDCYKLGATHLVWAWHSPAMSLGFTDVTFLYDSWLWGSAQAPSPHVGTSSSLMFSQFEEPVLITCNKTTNVWLLPLTLQSLTSGIPVTQWDAQVSSFRLRWQHLMASLMQLSRKFCASAASTELLILAAKG